jgi:cyclohexanecarboxylate-CoA ligase
MSTQPTQSTSEIRASMSPVPASEETEFLASGFWRMRTMLDDLLDQVNGSPRKAALVTYTLGSATPHTLTYGQLGAVIDRFAGALLELGVRRDDVISIQMPNGWQYAAVSLAAS